MQSVGGASGIKKMIQIWIVQRTSDGEHRKTEQTDDHPADFKISEVSRDKNLGTSFEQRMDQLLLVTKTDILSPIGQVNFSLRICNFV